MKSGVFKFSCLIGLLFFFSCKEEAPWPDPIVVPLNAEAQFWFNKWEDTSFIIKVFSSDGLTDAYQIHTRQSNDSFYYTWFDTQRVAFFSKGYGYSGSIYGNEFSLDAGMYGYPDFYHSIYITYRNYLPDYTNPYNFYAIFDTLFHPDGFATRHRDHYTYEDTFHNTLSYLGTFTINNKTYHEVYKYENPILLNKGLSFDIVELYFDKHYGLLQFKYKNGRIWTLDL